MIPASEERTLRHTAVDPRPIRVDHRTIRSMIGELGDTLAGLAAGEAGAAGAMQRGLDELRDMLVVHLEREERSGVLEAAAEEEPRFAPQIDALVAEHDDLRRSVGELCDGCGESPWDELHARFVEFRVVLEEHEQAENEMLVSVYYDDIGGHN